MGVALFIAVIIAIVIAVVAVIYYSQRTADAGGGSGSGSGSSGSGSSGGGSGSGSSGGGGSGGGSGGGGSGSATYAAGVPGNIWNQAPGFQCPIGFTTLSPGYCVLGRSDAETACGIDPQCIGYVLAGAGAPNPAGSAQLVRAPPVSGGPAAGGANVYYKKSGGATPPAGPPDVGKTCPRQGTPQVPPCPPGLVQCANSNYLGYCYDGTSKQMWSTYYVPDYDVCPELANGDGGGKQLPRAALGGARVWPRQYGFDAGLCRNTASYAPDLPGPYWNSAPGFPCPMGYSSQSDGYCVLEPGEAAAACRLDPQCVGYVLAGPGSVARAGTAQLVRTPPGQYADGGNANVFYRKRINAA